MDHFITQILPTLPNEILRHLLIVALCIVLVIMAYQFALTISGFFLAWRSRKERETILNGLAELPPVTILVPAHNEEVVIEQTVRTMLALDYPADKLEIFVINDASDDATGEILDDLMKEIPNLRVLHRTRPEGGRGKAAALNAALKLVKNEYVAIYDADNRPEPEALKLLVAHFGKEPRIGAVLGKFRTGNRRRNILTAFINIEGLGFQGIMQGGRFVLTGASMLSGTNYIIRRSMVDELGGWDEEALAEDAELSVRIYQAGYKIVYVPYSRSWEQEPETFGVWIRQRTRWARGTNYAVLKLLRTFFKSKNKLVALEMLFNLVIPYALLYAILFYQFAFVVSIFGVQFPKVMDIPQYFWFTGITLYYLEILLVLSYDKEATPSNMGLILVMYFTYCQIWPLAYLRAIFSDVIRHEKRDWDKTVRFETEIEGTASRRTRKAPELERIASKKPKTPAID